MKYIHIPLKQIKKEYPKTISYSFIGLFLAILTFIVKIKNLWCDHLIFICGVHTSLIAYQYLIENKSNIKEIIDEVIITDLLNEKLQKIITLYEAEEIKNDGDEWKP